MGLCVFVCVCNLGFYRRVSIRYDYYHLFTSGNRPLNHHPKDVTRTRTVESVWRRRQRAGRTADFTARLTLISLLTFISCVYSTTFDYTFSIPHEIGWYSNSSIFRHLFLSVDDSVISRLMKSLLLFFITFHIHSHNIYMTKGTRCVLHMKLFVIFSIAKIYENHHVVYFHFKTYLFMGYTFKNKMSSILIPLPNRVIQDCLRILIGITMMRQKPEEDILPWNPQTNYCYHRLVTKLINLHLTLIMAPPSLSEDKCIFISSSYRLGYFTYWCNYF